MYSNEIESVIEEYLKNPRAEYAVMIDGNWGSGKTYFLTHSLLQIVENIDMGKNRRRKYAYVTLYGVKSIDEVSREIVFQYFGKKHRKKTETVDTIVETTSNLITASLGAVNIDLSKIKDTLTKININDWIICFDDLERCCIPINEILGYMNGLVEHNKCKVIVLANEKEIGKTTLAQNLENKYQVILSGRKLLLNQEEKSNKDNESIDSEKLREEVKQLFNEDIIYKSIREKVIGLTIKYEPEMDVVYDTIISSYNNGRGFRNYLNQKKTKILEFFKEEECSNIRTLIAVLSSIQKVYNEMFDNEYNNTEYFNKIMDEFLKYVVLITIFYKNGGKVSDLKLTTEIGYVPLDKNSIYNKNIKGFKFLEKYCTTLSFSKQEFINVVSQLKREYEAEKKQKEKLKIGWGKAYENLICWWELEDNKVQELIELLWKEIAQNKYPFNNYQSIIGQLMVLEHYGHDIGNMDELIETMNQNIEGSEEMVDVERHSFTFAEDPSLRRKYEEYVDKLKLNANKKNLIIKTSELSQYIVSDNWTEELFQYCDIHYSEFICRYGFIDLLDIESLLKKMKDASPKELCQLKDIFKLVYQASNIKEFFINDYKKIKLFKNEVEQLNFTGINKNLAKKNLVKYLDDIIQRLE